MKFMATVVFMCIQVHFVAVNQSRRVGVTMSRTDRILLWLRMPERIKLTKRQDRVKVRYILSLYKLVTCVKNRNRDAFEIRLPAIQL